MSSRRATGDRTGPAPAYGPCSSTTGWTTPVYWRPDLAPGDVVVGPAIIEEFGSTVPLHPGFTATVDRFGNLVGSARKLAVRSATERRDVDPVVLEIVEGSLAAIEKEVETAIGRTARSPMIRDAHDFRAGIHDRKLRKLTGRSYSALVHPVARDFPLDTMRPGDVFFHNDVYLSEGGIGHLPDLCVTVPVFVDDGDGPVVAFVQAFGHHDDIGGAVPGSMPSHADLGLRGGADGPADQAVGPGRAQRGGAADHDPQLADARLAGGRPRRRVLGLPDGRAPARRAVRPLRPGDGRGLLRRDHRQDHRDLPARDPGEDPGRHLRVGGLRRARRRRRAAAAHPADHPDDGLDPGRAAGARLHRHLAAGQGPINHCGDYADGNFLKKWLAPILRNLADTPERMAELDVNEGIVPLIEMRFPPPGTLLTPVFPAPTNARTFVILRLLGVLAGVLAKAVDGRMPADQETIRYTGVYGDDLDGEPYLMREVLGGGSGGRYYADGEDTIHVVPDSRNLPTEFTESRFPFLVERLGLAVDSGGAGPLPRRAGLREAHPDAARRALHVDRGPLDPRLLGGQGRPGRAAVPGDRSTRAGRASGRSTRWPTPSRCGPVRSSGSGRPAAAAGATRWTARWPRSSQRRRVGQGVASREPAATTASCWPSTGTLATVRHGCDRRAAGGGARPAYRR